MPNRILAGVALAVAVGLVAWIAVPGNSGSSVFATSPLGSGGSASPGGASGSASSGSAGSASVLGASGGAQPGSAGAAGSATGSPGSSSAGATGAAGAASGTPGTVATGSGAAAQTTSGCTKTGSAIKIGIILPNVGSGSASGNSFLGVPAVSEQEADYNAVIDSINKAGGVQCHPLVGDYQAFDELDSSDSETICLQFAQDHVFAALGGFGPLTPDTCLLQNKIPTIEQIMISEADAKTYYPYYMSTNGAYELLIRNFVFATARLGYFGASKGFKKLGVLLRTCQPTEQPALMNALAANGVSSSQVDTFSFGCNTQAVADPPNEISQAELQFWHDGVTEVTAISDSTDLQDFTNDANNQQAVQHWKPQYLVPDDGAFATISSTQNVPNGNQFNGAIGITALQYGGIAANLPESAATQKCDAIMTAHHLPTVYQSSDNFAGNPCDLLWMLTGAMADDPGLAPTGLAPALNRMGTVAMSYPDGPNNFSAPGVTWGGEDWREDVFYASCSCFKATSPNFQNSF